MTKLEVCQEVLNDKNRSDDDRAKAIAILRRLAEGDDRDERIEAEKILATLPLSQADEDAKALASLNFKQREGTAFRADYRPEYRYDQKLRDLCGLLCTDACLFFKDRDHAAQSVEALNDLIARTQSEVIREAAGRAIENTRRVWKLATKEQSKE
jgi:hypothetical protein